jgi:hypothetical protein
MSNLRDPVSGLSCSETPLLPGRAISRDDIAKCNSCTLVFASPNTGPKTLKIGPKNGIEIDESPMTQMTYNNQTFSLFRSFIWPMGIHRDFKSEMKYDMEMHLYLRDIFKPNNIIAVSIPITISDSKGQPYFSELGTKGKYTLESLITTDMPVLMYKGTDLRDRDSYNTATLPQCNSKSDSVIWFVLSTTYINSNDAKNISDLFYNNSYAKPKSKKEKAENTPPICDKEITIERIKQMAMIIPTINTKTNIDRLASENNKSTKGIYLTRALQCQRIDPITDVSGDAVYLKGLPQTNLQQELDRNIDLDKPLDTEFKSPIRAKTMETYLGIFLGILFGLAIFGIVCYFIMTYVYHKYDETIDNNNTIISSTMKKLLKTGYTVPGLPSLIAQQCPVPVSGAK